MPLPFGYDTHYMNFGNSHRLMRLETYRRGLHTDDQDFTFDVMEPVLVRVLQGEGTNGIHMDTNEPMGYIWIQMYIRGDLGELVHRIMEAKKSHELASASRRTRKACDVTQSYYKSLRTRGAKGVRPNLNLKAQEAGAPMSQGRRRAVPQFKQSRLALFCFFVTSGPSMDWTMSTHTGDGDCHYQFADSNANANLF